MPYTTTGEVHHAGVSNEARIANKFTSSPPECFGKIYPGILTFHHRGGTSQVSDVEIRANSVRVDDCSLKLHRKGTFDHVNTSKIDDYIQNSALVEVVNAAKRAHHGDKNSIEAVRKSISHATNSAWDAMSSEGIRRLLLSIDFRTPRWLIVTEKDSLSIIDHSDLRELSFFPKQDETVYFLKSTPRAKTSRQIWRRSGDIETNTTLRVRLTLNNGVNALLGLSESNKNSVLTLKVQQDSVDSLLKQLPRSVVSLA